MDIYILSAAEGVGKGGGDRQERRRAFSALSLQGLQSDENRSLVPLVAGVAGRAGAPSRASAGGRRVLTLSKTRAPGSLLPNGRPLRASPSPQHPKGTFRLGTPTG